MKAAFVMDTAMKTVISTHYFDTFKTGLHIYIYIYISIRRYVGDCSNGAECRHDRND